MPLCTIFTKCPEPPGPRYATLGVVFPSWRGSGTGAAIASRSGLNDSYASRDPPGIIAEPLIAPRSPPDTPMPMTTIPCAPNSRCRRSVS